MVDWNPQQEGILDDTIIVFTSDHGDMLGNHGTVAKRLFYEESANVPLIIVGTDKTPKINNTNIDNRLTGLRDIMPTLLDMSGVAVPKSVEGISLDQRKRGIIFMANMEKTQMPPGW